MLSWLYKDVEIMIITNDKFVNMINMVLSLNHKKNFIIKNNMANPLRKTIPA